MAQADRSGATEARRGSAFWPVGGTRGTIWLVLLMLFNRWLVEKTMGSALCKISANIRIRKSEPLSTTPKNFREKPSYSRHLAVSPHFFFISNQLYSFLPESPATSRFDSVDMKVHLLIKWPWMAENGVAPPTN